MVDGDAEVGKLEGLSPDDGDDDDDGVDIPAMPFFRDTGGMTRGVVGAEVGDLPTGDMVTASDAEDLCCCCCC